ncbi:acyl-CoA dehydrogenase family protein [Microbacterium saperdae]|uniref:Alkylation response protein AidB-like acyl-CoA dehydrogenase n=1 Tax=Microbacterium saperdae TaxID=69368 RepID=A0A543B9V7_9MICO|nr:acyl-CoA dehydrogenase family protein [Microbacterium saperdae]TQL81635.1 alkylation response protein AidB-like acyl-CoA dehydrogenase [Microbacterium saperdae]
MTTITASSLLAPPTALDADLSARFQPVFDRIAEGNRERESVRAFPTEQVRWLIEAGFGRLRIPESLGGWGASLRQTFQLLTDLGEADPNVSHVWRNHLAFVEDRLNAEPSETTTVWLDRLIAGDFVGGGWTEANNGSFSDLKTILRPQEESDGWLLTGAKFYATGSLYADWLDVLGRTDDGRILTALVRREQPGVELTDDWPGFGQQTTASGSATYRDARVDAQDIFPVETRFSYQGLFYQTSLLAILAGIARAARRDGVAALKARTRTYAHALDQSPVDDAQLLQVIGRVSAHAYAAEAAVQRSSASIDAVAEAHAVGDAAAEKEALIRSTVETDQAQLVAIQAALDASTIVFDALGASGVSKDLLLDRHWRNARTLASHNPRVYKERIVGDWFVRGTDPTKIFGELSASIAAGQGAG